MIRLLPLFLALTGCVPSSAMPPSTPTPPAASAAALVDLEPPSTPVAGLTLRHVRYGERTYRVASLDLQTAPLELAGQDGLPRPVTPTALAASLAEQGKALIWATNAGIFQKGGRPSGLYVEAGVVKRPLATGNGAGNFYLKPNGAFLVGPDGARIRTTEELASDGLGEPRIGSQSGPILCRAGTLHPAFHDDSPNLLLRSGVGVSDARHVHFAMSDGAVRFHELATLFRDGLDAPDALYLDGVISQWVQPDMPPGPTDGGFGGLFFVAAPR